MEKQEKPIKIDPKTQSVIDAFVTETQKKVDPQGSYTGKPRDKHEVPVQDVDDL